MKITTQKGYAFFEVSSAFQKAIRRNDEKTALYFGVELFNSGYDEYAWRRMKIICSEDVGLAEPMMAANLQALYVSYQQQKADKKDNKPERLFYVHAITMLCRAQKSRLIDWLCISLWREHDDAQVSIPDYAYDMHNQKGKSMGRGLQHFYNDGTVLENHSIQPGEDEAKQNALNLHMEKPGKLSFTQEKKGNIPQQKAMFE